MEDLLRGSTAVAPSLQPYVAGAGAVETGLYRFLSPISIEVRFAFHQRKRGGGGSLSLLWLKLEHETFVKKMLEEEYWEVREARWLEDVHDTHVVVR